jgi:phosphotransferase system HPr (HPr) family protein
MTQSLDITVRNKVGLHARPATLFVKEVARHSSKIRVENLANPSRAVDGRSLLMILSLGVQNGHTIRITADGIDEVSAVIDLKTLIDANFGEG